MAQKLLRWCWHPDPPVHRVATTPQTSKGGAWLPSVGVAFPGLGPEGRGSNRKCVLKNKPRGSSNVDRLVAEVVPSQLCLCGSV